LLTQNKLNVNKEAKKVIYEICFFIPTLWR